MNGQTIHDGPVGYEVAYRHERLLAEADARRLRAQLARPARVGPRTGDRRTVIAVATATGLLILSGAWASLLGASDRSSLPAPAASAETATAPAAGPATGGGGAGGVVAR